MTKRSGCADMGGERGHPRPREIQRHHITVSSPEIDGNDVRCES